MVTSRESRVVAVALAAAAVVKGVGFAPQLVLEAYEALQASITSREPYVRLSELFRMEQHPRSVHNGGWLAEMFDDTASLDEHADLVDRAQQLFTMTLPVLAERAEVEADTHLMGLLGGLFGDLRRLDQSEDWYTKAAEFGDATAMLTLAALLEEWGRAAEAEQWHRRAAELGRTDAMILLAERLAADASRQAEAKELYYRAAAAGDVAAMTELARRADDRGAVGEAEMWHRNALYVDHANGQDLFDFFRFGKNIFWTSEKQEELAESGDVRAMRCRALDLRKQGDVGAAEQWYRRAVDAGDPSAMLEFSELLFFDAGRAAEAESWCSKAVDAGYRPASIALGHYLYHRGRHAEAVQCYRSAAAAGYLVAKDRLEQLDPGRR